MVAKWGSIRNRPVSTSCEGPPMHSAHLLAQSAHGQRWLGIFATAVSLLIMPCLFGCSKNSSSEVSASGSDRVMARVNGTEIKESDLALAEEDLGPELQAASPEAKRDHLVSYLTDVRSEERRVGKECRSLWPP